MIDSYAMGSHRSVPQSGVGPTPHGFVAWLASAAKSPEQNRFQVRRNQVWINIEFAGLLDRIGR